MRYVKIVNPDTGHTLFDSVEALDDAERAALPWTPPGTLEVVRIVPSVRPELDYDLATYPRSWVVPA